MLTSTMIKYITFDDNSLIRWWCPEMSYDLHPTYKTVRTPDPTPYMILSVGPADPELTTVKCDGQMSHSWADPSESQLIEYNTFMNKDFKRKHLLIFCLFPSTFWNILILIVISFDFPKEKKSVMVKLNFDLLKVLLLLLSFR